MTRKTYCGNLLWQSGLTLLALLARMERFVDERRSQTFLSRASRIASITESFAYSRKRALRPQSESAILRLVHKNILVGIERMVTVALEIC